MGHPVPHKKIKLIIGFIFSDAGELKKAEEFLLRKIGSFDAESAVFDFRHTDYYKKEFGENLKRKFVSLKRLVSLEDIFKIKLITDEIEKKISNDGRRLVNIDPGYITESKLVLLTTKDYSHRIYLKKGIYAEITLKFRGGTFGPTENTYPDYKGDGYIKFFNHIRMIYKEGVK